MLVSTKRVLLQRRKGFALAVASLITTFSAPAQAVPPLSRLTRPSAASSTARPATPDTAVRTITWQMLSALDYRKGNIPASIQQLAGQRVRLPGFVVPLDDLQETVKEFLLVPYFGACIHMPPPPPNQMVFARLVTKATVSMWNPVWIEGRLEVTPVQSPYGVVSYRIAGERITPYRN
ncbi:MAG: DUF3299 domain-containing protein [Phycisphaerae bacterium]|nr:DUF3299 domain-containing protein [Gemmatimonadaceae bacterium]